jgi:preprotein translocase subunit YajC
MIDISQFFINSAWAMGDQPPGAAQGAGAYVSYVPFILIFAIFYILILRPQQKRLDEQSKMIKALQRGDRVVTSGGIHGKIIRIEGEDHVVLEIADDVHIKVVKGHIGALAAKTEPVAANDGKASGKS